MVKSRAISLHFSRGGAPQYEVRVARPLKNMAVFSIFWQGRVIPAFEFAAALHKRATRCDALFCFNVVEMTHST